MRARILLVLFFSLAGCTQPALQSKSSSEFKPAPGATLETLRPLNTIVFGSCADPRLPSDFWSVLMQEKPDLFLATGDNVYASRPTDKPIRRMYEILHALPLYAQFRSQVPILATWDDHDYGQGDGGADNPEKFEAKRDFLNVYHNDAALIPPTQEGIYHAVTLGPKEQRTQILLLDTRWFRSALEKNQKPKHDLDIYQPTSDTSKTLLGQAQWKWLEEKLREPADLRILVTSIQFLAEEHGFEKWANFPHERKRLLDLLRRLRVKNLIMVSGDRHAGEISRLSVPGFNLIDATSSGLNKVGTIESEPNQLRHPGVRVIPANYGLISIDWKKRQARVLLKTFDGKIPTQVLQKF